MFSIFTGPVRLWTCVRFYILRIYPMTVVKPLDNKLMSPMNEIWFLFDRILLKGVCLWLKQLNVDVPKDVQQRKVCFGLLVENEGKQFLNALQHEIDAAYNECERSYLAYEALNVLEQKLERTALLIEYHTPKVEPSYPFYPYSCIAAQTSMPDVLYVLQLVKNQLIHLYLEVRDAYKKYHVPQKPLMGVYGACIDEWKYGSLDAGDMSVGEPVAAFGAEEGKKIVERKKIVEVIKTDEPGFKPLMYDVRPQVKGVLAYDDIVDNKLKFARLEVALFDNDLIEPDYQFKKKPHGNVMMMAAVYWVAIKKGYFRKHYFKERHLTAISAHDVRKFLNHRYQINILRQFQNFAHEDVLNKYLAGPKVGWISVIDSLQYN